ncbi:MAG: peptidoglycan recognition family protein [Patescibacteria group bacterium]
MKLPRENVKYLIVHQSATPKAETSFEKIKKFHLKQGMGNIAYHYFIEANGKLRKGRNESTAGTHTKASQMNLKSLGVCLAGDFNYEDPNSEQLEALAKILDFLASKYQIPKNNILGHNEVIGSVTECPGISLNEWIVKYRDSKA